MLSYTLIYIDFNKILSEFVWNRFIIEFNPKKKYNLDAFLTNDKCVVTFKNKLVGRIED